MYNKSNTYIYTEKIAITLKIVSMLINLNRKIIKTIKLKTSFTI